MIGDTNVNHILVIRYQHGKIHHIPWHSDKQEGVDCRGAKDIRGETSIYNAIVCDSPRVFQLANAADIDEDNNASSVVFSEALPHGSLVTLTAVGNRMLKHRVPKDAKWRGCRYSIVMRSVKQIGENAVQKKNKKRKVQGELL